jgi:hypothetical protein
MQTGRVHGDKRIARAHRVDNREQAPEHEMVHRDRDEADARHRMQPQNHPLGVRAGSQIERADDPALGRHRDEQDEDGRPAEPVDDHEESQHDVGDWQRCGRRHWL